MTPEDYKRRRRKERWLAFSPGEWIWVIGYLVIMGAGFAYWLLLR
jgi:hypothetical protein